MLTVHHLEKSRSQRVLWLLEELGIPYALKVYPRDRKTMLAPAELKAVHPLGKSPVITDGDLTIAESAAILEYLFETYGDKAPAELGVLKPLAGTPAHRQYTYWMHYAEGSLMPSLVMKLIFTRIPTQPMPFFVRPIARHQGAFGVMHPIGVLPIRRGAGQRLQHTEFSGSFVTVSLK